METNLLDRMLDKYMTGHTPVTMTLQNKVRVSGRIRAFDSYVVVMEGQKREILYRHAISGIVPLVQEERKRQPLETVPATAKTPPPRLAKAAPRKTGQTRSPALAAATNDGLSNSMKDGLLRWMQEQKAAK
jgi:RNA chaperone Hfq